MNQHIQLVYKVFFRQGAINMEMQPHIQDPRSHAQTNGKIFDATRSPKHGQLDINPENIREMAQKKFYESLNSEYREAIDDLYKRGARPTDIIITEDGFGVKKPEQSLLEDQERIKLDQSKIHELLINFHGKSIDYTVKHANQQELDALTNLTVYYLTQSEKKAFTISDEKLPDLWKKVRGIYEHQAQYRDNTKESIDVMRYTERYSDLKHFSSKKAGFKRAARRTATRIYSFLSYSLRPSHRTRLLKQKMTKVVRQEKARKEHLEEKYGSNKALTGKIVDKNQRIKLYGRRGSEQKKLGLIIEHRKKYQNRLDDIKLEEVKGKLPFRKMCWDIKALFDECAEKPQFKTEVGRLRLASAREALNYYSNIVINDGLQKTKYMVGEFKIQNEEELAKLKESLEKTIKKYGSSSWGSWLNDIASDGGAAFTVATTSLAIAGTVA
jgi:hypothetical protein